VNAISSPVRRLYDMMKPKWLYVDAHYLVADMEIDPDQAKRIVPSPLRLASPAKASLFVAWFPNNTFGSDYREVGLFLHVIHRWTRAIHCPWMLVDDDVALILGRELLGYPKKLGAIEFSIEGDRVRGLASRRGAELVRMEGTLKERVADPPPMLGRPHRNVRASLGLALPKVLAFTPHEEAIEVRRAELEVRVGRSDRDPLADLGFGRVLEAYLHRVNLGASLRALPVPLGGVSPIGFVKQWLIRTH
jgi:acetoacetate decarboxylase